MRTGRGGVDRGPEEVRYDKAYLQTPGGLDGMMKCTCGRRGGEE
jgi:hypothetical protein